MELLVLIVLLDLVLTITGKKNSPQVILLNLIQDIERE